MTVRVAMWSGPRNISTAMMRAFENRRDCAVVDEPLYAAYLDQTGIDHPGRDQILASQPRDWQTVAARLCAESPAPVFYQKHMTQHLLPDMDLSFTSSLTNCFLIREPRRIIASYARVRPDFTLEELGFSQQLELFNRECDRLGSTPPVLDASLTLKNPESVLRQLCDAIEITWDEAMLSWPAGPRDSDGVWAPHWYSAVLKSTGFAVASALRAETAGDGSPELIAQQALSPQQEALCEQANAMYERLLIHAFRP